MRTAAIFALLSGISALVFEVLWLRQLGLLFGNTAHAAATGFSLFFAGLALGSWVFGQRAPTLQRPLFTYAWIEIGIAASGSLYFWLPDVYRALHGQLYALAGESPIVFVAAKAGLSAVALLPPAFFMGATIPVLGQAVITRADALGREGAHLYALNTAGAAAGALAAGFLLPQAFGFRGTCLFAMAINGVVAVGAFLVNARMAPSPGRAVRSATQADAGNDAGHAGGDAHVGVSMASRAATPIRLRVLAAVSGGAVLGIEVAATRLFAQVFQNSVYTFAIVLAVFLTTLATGSFIAGVLARRSASPWSLLGSIMLMAGILVATVPYVFFEATGGLQTVAPGQSWGAYVAIAFGLALAVLAGPCVVAGVVFPFLLRLAQGHDVPVGHTIGTLSAWNTAGAIAGAALTGFIILPVAGLWLTFTTFGTVYLLTSLGVLARHGDGWMRVAPVFAAVPILTVALPIHLPLLRLNEAAGERPLDVWESQYGVTAVVERQGERLIKVNNHYALGGTGSVEQEQNQARLPLFVYPDARSLFFLGMGTGISAGGAVVPGVDRIDVAELIPDVVRAARTHFRDVTNGLFEDPRVRIVVNDGRSELAVSGERYDLIVGDLFVPWEAGTGSLYTREHFEAVRERLGPGGVFVQWLPLYQLSEPEFMAIARTMLAVFGDVVLWRGDFSADGPFVALAGATHHPPLDFARVLARVRAIDGSDLTEADVQSFTLPYYAGHLSLASGVVPNGPLNVDDRPIVEHAAPVSQRRERAGEISWFTMERLLTFFDRVFAAAPVDADPYLARLSAAERDWVRAGREYYAASVHRALGDQVRATQATREALRLSRESN